MLFVARYHMVTEKATADTMAKNNKFSSSFCSLYIESVLLDASLQTLKDKQKVQCTTCSWKVWLWGLPIFVERPSYWNNLQWDIWKTISALICVMHMQGNWFFKTSVIPWVCPNVHKVCIIVFFFLNGCKEKREDTIYFLQDCIHELMN